LQYQTCFSQLDKIGKSLGFKILVLPETFQDAEGAVKAAKKMNEEVDFAILDVATCPEGKAASAFFDSKFYDTNSAKGPQSARRTLRYQVCRHTD
jgi:hypothetical protein